MRFCGFFFAAGLLSHNFQWQSEWFILWRLQTHTHSESRLSDLYRVPLPPLLACVCSLSTVSHPYYLCLPPLPWPRFLLLVKISTFIPKTIAIPSFCLIVAFVHSPRLYLPYGLPCALTPFHCVLCVWPGHFRLNIYRPIYLLPGPCWFKYWQHVFLFSQGRAGRGS